MRHDRGREWIRLLTRQSDNAILRWGRVRQMSMTLCEQLPQTSEFRDVTREVLYVELRRCMSAQSSLFASNRCFRLSGSQLIDSV